MAAQQEIELKLGVAPERANDVWKSAAIRPWLRSPPASRTVFSAYYDTPGFELCRRGAAIRLRCEAGRWIQTVKIGAAAVGGLHEHREVDSEVASQALDFSALVEAGLGELIAREEDRSRLAVVFTTRFRRRRATIEPAPGLRIEIAVDRGEIRAGSRRAPISEIELELKAGEPRALFALARELLRDLPLRLENTTKAQRGYRLANGKAVQPVKAAPIELSVHGTVDAAFATVATACLRQLQANEAGVLRSRDPEYIHQARVALRRLRAAFGVFSRAVPKSAFRQPIAALKTLAALLGQARDWDVFLTQTLPQAQVGAQIDLTGVRRRALRARSAARRAARAAIEALSYTELMLDLALALRCDVWQQRRTEEHRACARMPLVAFARKVLERRQRKLLERGAVLESADAAALHRLRIDAKKLRYGCEFFASLFPGSKTQGYIERLADLQDALGRINDAASAVRLVDALCEHAGGVKHAALGYLRSHCAADMQEQLRPLKRAWERFSRAAVFW
ncbi:MAG TPA: CHAD domain-containing protein [Burkholderiales bacterium]|jgi:triphosphatase|nr:CHAD domain-containing protein [Burkholderiales bacterium]